MDLQRISDPITREQKLTVVTLREAKEQERILQDREDTLIGNWIETAYDYLSGPEGWTNGYCLLEEQFEFYVDDWRRPLRLPVRPFLDGGLLSFSRFDVDTRSYLPLDPSSFIVGRDSDTGIIQPTDRFAIARLNLNFVPRAYRVRFAAGQPNADTIPSPLKQAMRMLVGHWYQNRETAFADPRQGTLSREVEYGLRALAGRYRVSPDHS